jgi:hypothetical protein
MRPCCGVSHEGQSVTGAARLDTRMEFLRNRHAGQRCVLVANGPSLNRTDLGALRNEIVIGMNKIYLGLRTFGFYPRYYVAVNRKVLLQAAPEIRALNCVKVLGSHARAAGIEQDALTYVVNTEHPPARFSSDLAFGMHEGWTVTYAALQVAWHLGFTRVVLVGLDHRYEYSGQPNESCVLHGADPNHFAPAYFGGGQEWDNPDLARSEDSFRIALDVFRRDGRTIEDATVDGACRVFPKVDLATALAA